MSRDNAIRSGSRVRHADGREGVVLRPGGPGVVLVWWSAPTILMGRKHGMTRSGAWAAIEGEPVLAAELTVLEGLAC